MKTFFKTLLLILVFVSTPLIILLTLMSHEVNFTISLKQELLSTGIYNQMLTAITNQAAQNKPTQEMKQIQEILWPLLQQQVTPVYLQHKTEKLIDDIQNWVTGKTNISPVVSLTDLKDGLITQHKKQYDQLLKLSREYKTYLAKMKMGAEETNDTESVKKIDQLASIDMEKFLTTDTTIPVGQYFIWLKRVHTIITTGLPILELGLSVSVLLIIWLSDSISSKLRWFGITCFMSALGSGAGYLMASGSTQFINLALANATGNLVPYMKLVIPPLISPLQTQFSIITKQAAVWFGVSAILLWILSLIIDKSHSAKKLVMKFI